MSALQKWPIISALIAAAFIGAPILIDGDRGLSLGRFEVARNEARDYWVSHPHLEVDSLGELILDSTWFDEARAASEASHSDFDIETPPRMMARAQAKFDSLVEDAYAKRMKADPAWRYGVLDARTPTANYYAHAFFHETAAGIMLCVVILLFAGAPLERSWGKGVYLAFVAATLPLTAYAFRLLDATAGVPWSGGAGLAGAALGAYFIRGLGGHFVVPGWMLLPCWLALEAVVVRNFWLDDLGGVPWASLSASVGFGALAAGIFQLLGLESKIDRLDSRRDRSAPNPIVSRAARLRSDGNPFQAFDLLQAAWRDNPLDEEVAEAFFLSAVEVDRPNAAGEAILPSLRAALREGDTGRALEYWLPLSRDRAQVRLEPSSSVRLGEALLDAGHQQEALFSLRGALDAGVSPSHAMRIVALVEGIDPALARHAATIALCDESLAAERRAELEAIAALADVMQPSPQSSVRPESVGVESDFLAGVDVTPRPVEPENRDAEAHLAEQALDAGALDPDSLSISFSEDMADILANDPDAVEDLLGPGGVEAYEEDAGLHDSSLADFEDSSNLFDVDNFRDLAESDSDLTPLMEASADGLTASPLGPLPGESSSTSEYAIGGEDHGTTSGGRRQPEATAEAPLAPHRALKALVAVPVEASNSWVEIDVVDRGKSRLPLDRIQAISMAAIEGLGSRSVLLVDFVLNWNEEPDEPLKVIRFRSDRFDPRRFEPAEIEPLHALSAWVRRLQVRSDATCLPDRQFLEGLFLHFESIEAYEAYVLMATAERADS